MSEWALRPAEREEGERKEESKETSDGGALGLPGNEQTGPYSSPREKKGEDLDEMQFDPSKESDFMRNRGLEQLEEALDLIPDEDKVDYVEALRRVPHLVKTESDPIRFLRRENFDAWAAASRLVTYWKMRKEIFGERAFLPLTLTGDGALRPEDVAALETGYFVPLPNDCEGRPVLCHDDTRLGIRDSKQKLRVFFYLLSIIAANPLCQTEGYSGVALMSKLGFSGLNNRQGAKTIVDLVEKAMPVRLRMIYVVRKSSNQGFLQMIIPRLLAVYGSYATRRFTPIFTDSDEETIWELKSYGMQENGLPETIGGSWKYEAFDQWLRKRKLMDRAEDERKLPAIVDTDLSQFPGAKGDIRRQVSVLPDESEESIQRGLLHLQDALELIPYEEKIDYLEALDRVPSLVQAESDPIRLLRCDGFDGWAAARRMVNYWRHRKTLFGERAFLPMMQTGKGALTEEDIDALKTGFMVLLPHNKNERSILCVDKSRMPAALKHETKLRCCFYMMQVMSENEASQRGGFVTLYLLTHMAFGKPISTAVSRVAAELSISTMPVRGKGVHVLCLPPKSKRRSFLEAAIPVTLRFFKLGLRKRQSVHVAESKSDMREKLEALGFDVRKLPPSLGGSWSYDNVAKWQQDRIEHELQVYTDFEYQDKVRLVASSDEAPIIESQRQVSFSGVAARYSHTSGAPVSVEHQTLCERAEVEVAETISELRRDESLASIGSVPSRAEEKDGLVHLAEALDLIPYSSKRDYLAAKERVPYLVAAESDPLRFLRCTAYDAWAAARRLVTYWEQRRAVFGERAFLPMDQTGHGALNEEDLRTLSSGFLVELPRDSQGRTVFCFDRQFSPDRNSKSASRAESRMRCMFYMLQVASENEMTQKDGIILLMRWNKEDLHLSNMRLCGKIFSNGMPVRLKAIRFLCCLPDAGEKSNLDISIFRVSQVFGKIGDEVTTIHVGESESELLRHLQELGFSKERVPTTLCGDWKYENCEGWNQQRRFIESSRQKEFLALYPAKAQFHPGLGTSLDVSRHRNAILAERETAPQSPQKSAEQAILLLPSSERAAYMEACARAPELAEEAFILQFLRLEKDDVKRAAKRVARYWETRKTLYGERAFLSLDQTGDGALTLDDVAVLKTGFFAVLPPDAEGRLVVCIDRSRLEPSMFCSASKLRAAFYVLSLVAESETAQSQGIICLEIFNGKSFEEFDPKFYKTMADLLMGDEGALPVQMKTTHVGCCTTGFLMRFFLKTFIPRLVYFLSAKHLCLHTAESEQGLAVKLQSYGLREHGLPSSLGGSWSYDSFAEWQRERVSHERKKSQTMVKHAGVTPRVTGKASDQMSLINSNLPTFEAGVDESKDTFESNMSINTTNTERAMAAFSAGQHDNLLLIADAISFVESESTKHQDVAGLEEAIQLLPESDKSALLEARRLVPEIVEKESDPVRFLRIERYNTGAAAKRLATYWRTRKDIFGERAFRPMSQTGEGTLHRGDMNALNSGHLLVLPKDSNGRTVLCYDSSRDTDQNVGSRMRLAFYFGCIAAANEVSQRDGCVILLVLSKSKVDVNECDGIHLLCEALPVRIHSIHVVNVPLEVDFFGSREALMPSMLEPALKERVIHHTANTKEKLHDGLREYGLSKEGLPRCIGGDWSYEMFAQWQDLRTRFEWELPTRQKTGNVGKMFNFSFKDFSELSEEDRMERRRRFNVLHSRRQRERQRIETGVLQEQVSEIREKNRRISTENQRLEQLLASARNIIAATTCTASQFDLGLPQALSSVVSEGTAAHSNVLEHRLVAQDMGAASQWSILASQNQGQRDTFGCNIDDRVAQDILRQQLHRESLLTSEYTLAGETPGIFLPTQILNYPNPTQQAGIASSANSVYINLTSSQQANAPCMQRHSVESLPGLAWRLGLWGMPPAEKDKEPRSED